MRVGIKSTPCHLNPVNRRRRGWTLNPHKSWNRWNYVRKTYSNSHLPHYVTTTLSLFYIAVVLVVLLRRGTQGGINKFASESSFTAINPLHYPSNLWGSDGVYSEIPSSKHNHRLRLPRRHESFNCDEEDYSLTIYVRTVIIVKFMAQTFT